MAVFAVSSVQGGPIKARVSHFVLTGFWLVLWHTTNIFHPNSLHSYLQQDSLTGVSDDSSSSITIQNSFTESIATASVTGGDIQEGSSVGGEGVPTGTFSGGEVEFTGSVGGFPSGSGVSSGGG